MSAALIARLDSKLRPLLVSGLPPKATVKLYSAGRKHFLARMLAASPEPVLPPNELSRTLWGIRFRSPICNAAGMFKNGEGYDFVAAQGAGAYLAGTTTATARPGNKKAGISLAFVPYPRSHASSNWLGLPNDGNAVVAERLRGVARQEGCPVGASLMASPDAEGEARLAGLLEGMKAYADAGVDFLEINESCPNTEHGRPQDDQLYARLQRIKTEFLDRLSRSIPVIVKFSNDTPLEQVEDLLKILFELGFDGVNFGNTSTSYDAYRTMIADEEQRLYSFFTSTFGGGLGGAPLRAASLTLTKEAVRVKNKHAPSQEFHIIRTGGIESAEDVHESLAAGASLVQWYTGYFEQFSQQGHRLYHHLYAELRAP